MTVGRLIGAAVCALVGLSAIEATASPLTYQFSGTFPQAFFGSAQFSGTFTYGTSLPLYPGAWQDANHAYYSGTDGSPIAMTLNLGASQTNPLGTPMQSELVVTHSPGYDEINVDVAYQSPTRAQPDYVTIGMLNNNGLSTGPFTSLDPPPSLKLSDFNFDTQFILRLSDGAPQTVVGTITSLSLVPPVPEPTAVVLFGALAAGLACRRTRRTFARIGAITEAN